MILPILVRGIDSNYYSINEYILLEIYLLGKRNNKDIRAKITREAYLIDDLKIKILLSTDVINLEKINIIILRNKIYIRSYNTTISIDLKPRSRDVIIKLVIANKKITLSPYSQIIIPVYYTVLPDDRDFLFKPKYYIEIISLYIYLVNDFFYLIIARNNIDNLIVILKYLRLNTVSKINYNNYYLATSE